MKVVVSDIETNGLRTVTNFGSVVVKILLLVRSLGLITVTRMRLLGVKLSSGTNQQT